MKSLLFILLSFFISGCLKNNNENQTSTETTLSKEAYIQESVTALHDAYWARSLELCELENTIKSIDQLELSYEINQDGTINNIKHNARLPEEAQKCIDDLFLLRAVYDKHNFDSLVFEFSVKKP